MGFLSEKTSEIVKKWSKKSAIKWQKKVFSEILSDIPFFVVSVPIVLNIAAVASFLLIVGFFSFKKG